MDFEALEEYAINHTTEESALVRELVKTSAQELEYIDMLSGRVVVSILQLLVKISDARYVLEVGTFTGYSALNMAEAMSAGGKLFTCEYNKRYEKIARTFFDRYKEEGGKVDIRLMMGPALKTIPQIEGSFDFVFLDADKINYPNYYNLILPRLKSGGIMVIDNVFWDGKVLAPNDEKSAAIDHLNQTIRDDSSVEQVMLTVRDGLTILRKK
jgi:caffeoyl-CoA O-methyltransferase